MKVCEVCGEEIGTKDGENRCASCDCDREESPRVTGISRKLAARRIKEQIYRDLGMVKVRGALGGTYWE